MLQKNSCDITLTCIKTCREPLSHANELTCKYSEVKSMYLAFVIIYEPILTINIKKMIYLFHSKNALDI